MNLCLRTLSFWLFLPFAPAWTQTVTPSPGSTYTASPAGSAWYGLVTLTLLVVLVAVVLRVFKRNATGAVSEGGIRVLASKSIGPRESVVVVELQGRCYLLGHTPTQVNLIDTLDDFDTHAVVPPAGPVGTLFGDGFASALTSALKKR